MRIHHLNCTTMRPPASWLQGTGPPFARSHLIVHCLLIESDDGLVLVDTGFGTRDLTRPTPAVRAFTALSATSRDVGVTAVRQVVALGYDVRDVRHVLFTHLHLDHAGGLPDFPGARIHVHAREYEAAMHPRTFVERFYRPEHWAHGPQWALHAPQGEQWFGLDCAPVLEGVSPEILLVPLTGHTRGHCGVAVRTAEGWLFHCGDGYAMRGDVYEQPVRSRWTAPLARRLFPHLPRLRALARSGEVRLFCSHDASEFAQFQGSG